MHVLLTGSSGQIGTNLALRLLGEGHTVFGIDKRPNTWTDQFPYLLLDLSQRFATYEDGFGDALLPFKPDVVVHFAANAKVHELVRVPSRAMDNIQMTYNVLEYCRTNSVPILFSSSREVYGDIKHFESDLATDESQADFKYTESPYSASKIAGEAMIYSYGRCYQLPYIVLRFSNVYGRFDNDIDRMERVIPLFVKRIASEEPITVFGREKVLDFTYVDDCVGGVYAAVRSLVEGTCQNRTINLAYGEGRSLLDLVDYIGSELGLQPNVTVEETQIGEVRHYVADITEARQQLGYAPQTPLQEGIKKTIAWWREAGHLPGASQK